MYKKIILISLLVFSFTLFSQNVNPFNLKIGFFDYPVNPLLANCTVYELEVMIQGANIFTKDLNGDKLILNKVTYNSFGLNPDSPLFYPKIYSFKKYHKPEIPYENGFSIRVTLSDVELYFIKSDVENEYNIKQKYFINVSIKYKNIAHTDKTFEIDELIEKFITQLEGNDVMIVAQNKMEFISGAQNEKIIQNVLNWSKEFIKEEIDLVYNIDSHKFYDLSKTNKLKQGAFIDEITSEIKELEKLNVNLKERNPFDQKIDELIIKLTHLSESDDYKNREEIRFYTESNLGNLFNIQEKFDDASVHYEKSLNNTDKRKLIEQINDKLQALKARDKKRKILFDKSGKVKSEYSKMYEKTRTNYLPEIN